MGRHGDWGARGSARSAVARALAVDASALGYSYRGGAGIEGIDLCVAPGEVVGVLGPNGAGKTTLLRLLATAASPATGSLRLLGTDASKASPALRRRLGYAPADARHFPHLTGLENATAFARLGGLRAADAAQAARTLLAAVGLAAYAGRQARTYSYGMLRRLTVCEALVHGPALALLDEPTAGLDPAGQETVARLLRENAARGAALVLASNDMALARTACDRVLFLHGGQAVLEGRPSDLMTRLGGATRIRVVLDGPPPAIELDGVRIVALGETVLDLDSTLGAAALPGLCAALIDSGASMREIVVRDADLRDVFAHVTGTAWEADAARARPADGSAQPAAVRAVADGR